jgi:hypothetical protein
MSCGWALACVVGGFSLVWDQASGLVCGRGKGYFAVALAVPRVETGG